jgi:DNA excision repair protein ERCC-2
MSSPYPSFRKGQRESVEFIRSRLGGLVAFKAPTGYGKTLVALLSHLGRGRVLYAVRTRNEMAPVIREARRVGASFTVVFSGRRMCPVLRGAEVEAEDFWLNCRLMRLKGMCPYYANLRSASPQEVEELLARSTLTDPHRLAEAVARELSVCPFFSLAGLASRVDVTVVTYPYVFDDVVYSTAFQDVGLDEFYLVVDEAHTLLNPQSVISSSVDLAQVRESRRELSEVGYVDLSESLRPLEEVLSRATSDRLARVRKEDAGITPDTGRALEEALYEVRLASVEALAELGVEHLVRLTSPLSKLVKFYSLALEDFTGVYAQATYDSAGLHALPTSYEPIRRRLRLARGVLLMSGTLPPKPILDRVISAESTYLDVEETYGRVFPREGVFYAVYPKLTTSYAYRSTRMFMDYARLVREVYRRCGRAVLAVYPSYEVMREVVIYLSDVGSMYVESGRSRISEVVEVLAKEPHTLVNAVAGGKIVEGVEFRDPGGRSVVDSVVVCGVPYPQPDDYLEDLRMSLEREVGPLARVVTTDMLAAIRTSQAIGRAIRSEADRAYVVLADRRYLKRELRELMGLTYDRVFTDLEELLRSLSSFLNPNT